MARTSPDGPGQSRLKFAIFVVQCVALFVVSLVAPSAAPRLMAWLWPETVVDEGGPRGPKQG